MAKSFTTIGTMFAVNFELTEEFLARASEEKYHRKVIEDVTRKCDELKLGMLTWAHEQREQARA